MKNKLTISYNLLFVLFITFFLSNSSTASAAATLVLSPTSATVGNSQTITVTIILDTKGQATDGIDIFSLNYNPAILQVVDDNTSASGVQITPGTLFPITVSNAANNSTGVIQFSQASSGGTTYTGSGTLATIHFQTVGSGTSAVTFDHTVGKTTDTNIAFQGTDLLTSVTNASFVVDATVPTVSISSPAAGASLSGSVNFSATASDTGGSSLAGVQFKIDGVNLGAEDTSSPYTISWNTATVSNTSHTLAAVARDNAGNTTSATRTITVNNLDSTAPSVSITQPTNNATVSGTAVTISATASDNSSVVGVQFKLDGSNLGVEDMSSPYSYTWNASSVTSGNHILTAVARDPANNQTTSSAVTVNVSNSLVRTIQLDLESRSSKAVSGNISVLNTSKSVLKTYPFTTNSSGAANITFDISPQTVYLKLNAAPFLTRIMSIDLNNTGTYTFSKLFIGDINQDNIVNSVDYSQLNAGWFTSDTNADLNKDLIVNSIDFSYMNQHWLATGEI